MDHFIHIQSWDKAIFHAESIARIYELLYVLPHPIVGLHLYTLGDLLLAASAVTRAQLRYTDALRILSITHGKDHHFVSNLQHKLQ